MWHGRRQKKSVLHLFQAVILMLSLRLYLISFEDLNALRLRFQLDHSIKNLMVLVPAPYTLNEK